MTTIATPNTLAKRKQRAVPGYKELEAARRKTHSYKKKEADWAWTKRNNLATWAGVVYTQVKSRAKQRGIEFSIDKEDIVVPEFCPVLGIKLHSVRGKNPMQNGAAPSVDRFDNDKGYVKGNVRVISSRANHLKSNATLEEMEAVVRYMRGEL
jgi:hypothetical protein